MGPARDLCPNIIYEILTHFLIKLWENIGFFPRNAISSPTNPLLLSYITRELALYMVSSYKL